MNPAMRCLRGVWTLSKVMHLSMKQTEVQLARTERGDMLSITDRCDDMHLNVGQQQLARTGQFTRDISSWPTAIFH